MNKPSPEVVRAAQRLIACDSFTATRCGKLPVVRGQTSDVTREVLLLARFVIEQAETSHTSPTRIDGGVGIGVV